jgi:hypothetical protein
MSGGGYALRCASRRADGAVHALPEAGEPGAWRSRAREVDRPGGGEELDSPYVHE